MVEGQLLVSHRALGYRCCFAVESLLLLSMHHCRGRCQLQQVVEERVEGLFAKLFVCLNIGMEKYYCFKGADWRKRSVFKSV